MKYVLINAVFDRDARLPVDVLFSRNRPDCPKDIRTDADYDKGRVFALKDVYDAVIARLQLRQKEDGSSIQQKGSFYGTPDW